MGAFKSGLFLRLVEEASFVKPWRFSPAPGTKKPKKFKKDRKDFPKPPGQFRGPLNSMGDTRNFKNALYALVMMRAYHELKKKEDDGSPDEDLQYVNVKLEVSFKNGKSMHSRNDHAIPPDVFEKMGIDTITIVGDANPNNTADDELLKFFEAGHFTLACSY